MSEEGDKGLAGKFLAISGLILKMNPGEVARLRRMDRSRACTEYWRIKAALALTGDDEAWMIFTRCLALLRPKPGAKIQSMHDPEGRLGRLMFECGISNGRFVRLLNASMEQRREQIVSTICRLGAGTRVDIIELGYLIWSDSDRSINGLARNYYEAENKQSRLERKQEESA